MTNAWTETWTENWFPGLLADAVIFDGLAQAGCTPDFPSQNRYARVAVTSATLSIEAAANCCLYRIAYPQIALRQLDKLGTLDKYALLYSARFGKDIDRGSRPFQAAAELIMFRNRYVHPKVGKSEVTITVDEAGEKFYEKVQTSEPDSKVLGLPFDVSKWTGLNSRSAVGETINFLNHFFTELCALDTTECSRLLSLFVKGQGSTACFLAVHDAQALRGVEETYGVKLKFLTL